MISNLAVIHPSAKIAAGVSIGPVSSIGEEVEIGEKTWIGPHVVINGPSTIGKENTFYQFCSIGEEGQNKKNQRAKDIDKKANLLKIGDRNIFRENMTVSKGTPEGGGQTCIGDDN